MDKKKLLEEKFKDMNIVDLKNFLQTTGVSVTGWLKPGLISIAYTVEEMNLPLINQPCAQEEKTNVNRCLYIHGTQLPDLLKMVVKILKIHCRYIDLIYSTI